MENLKAEINSFLEANQNSFKAERMKAYMKGRFTYFGINAPTRKTFFKSFWAKNKSEILPQWEKLTKWLWQQNEREYQYIAMEIIGKIEKKLTIKHEPLIRSFIIQKSWWDTVDFLASHGIGQILKDNTELQMKYVDQYMSSDDLWLQRTALIFQLFYKQKTNKDLLFAMIDATLGSKEFFINKASGWALRQYSRVNPALVKQYIDYQRPNLSNLTIREGSKYLND
ncbi:MAG: DNA alkylation repair protein [Saprospiraceae bacterium]|nr:DNA alkylation repair protein [Bacteroidia bacterium]NNE13942.1 DNA alkylation repair protein [Saprospiraceae bacterium]NNL93684.1 DNA alkylation repair protein [Saprospiraceae bacterium]